MVCAIRWKKRAVRFHERMRSGWCGRKRGTTVRIVTRKRVINDDGVAERSKAQD